MVTLNGNSCEDYSNAGGEKLRYDYKLNPNDLVLDIGSFNDEWNKNLPPCNVIKFEAQNDTAAWLFDGEIDLGGFNNCMSMFDSQKVHKFRCIDISKYMNDEIAVCKINIEGGEYELLDYMLSTGKINNILNIQVQFHIVDSIPYEKLYNDIAAELIKTHEPTWQFKFCWENWRRKW